jgi:RimJ/RimL family protein N-acetyltransferase
MTVAPLAGRFVRLEPLAELHRGPLRAAADDPRVWEWQRVDGRGPAFDRWFDGTLADAGKIPFAVRRVGGDLVGSTSFIGHSPAHRRVEIGATWYAPACWGTPVNPECKLLLLRHAFDVWGVNRVSFQTDALNLRSQRAIAKLGAVREGVLRQDVVTHTGRVRDSVIFSVVASEWPAVRERLEARLRVT